ncbi:MAG: hypothetical protein LBN05_07175 [Oscillospiraceae bacterium]|jgi:hypothetical protein|nr:hypothetical protein [Oscillospiraceae bacterium]
MKQTKQTMTRRTLAVLLVLTLLLSVVALLPGTAVAASTITVTVGQMPTTMVTGAETSVDIPHTYTYSDDYFAAPSTTYNNALAQATLGLEWSAWGASATFTPYNTAPVAADQAANLLDYYNQTGFTNIELFDYDKSQLDERDRTAFSIAQKTLPDGTILLAVPVRGGNYGAEWVSNGNLGTGVNHQGFDAASDLVVDAVKARVATLGGADVKLWLTGFSRGAATANLVAAKLDDWGGVAHDHLFAYTFATPLNTTNANAKTAAYNNIFNIVNPVDLVPILPLGSWGFTRFGVDKFLQFVSTAEADYAALNARYAAQFAGLYTGTFPAHIATWEQFVSIYDVSYLLGKLVPTQGDFDAKLQGIAKNILRKFADGTLTQVGDWEEFFTALFGAENAAVWTKTKNIFQVGAALISPLWDLHSQVDLATFVLSAGTVLAGSVQKPSTNDVLQWLDALYVVGGTDIFEFSAFINNFVTAHTPESYYTLLGRGGGAEDSVFGSGQIKNVRVDGAAAATLSAPNGDANIADLPTATSGARKYYYLPAAKDFALDVTADGSGFITLHIDTMDTLSVKTRQSAFYDIATASGQRFTAAIPADAGAYTLTSGAQTRTATYDSLTVPPGHVHSFGAWVVSRPSQGGEYGEEYRTCADCGKREVLPFLVFADDGSTPTSILGKMRVFFARIIDWLKWFFTGGIFKFGGWIKAFA